VIQRRRVGKKMGDGHDAHRPGGKIDRLVRA
jgi:hypothetical protein